MPAKDQTTAALEQEKLKLEITRLQLDLEQGRPPFDLEQEKLKLEIERLRLDLEQSRAMLRQTEAWADSTALGYERDRESWIIRNNAQRVFTFHAPFHGDSVTYCMNRVRDFLDIDPTKRIEIIINSPGGSVDDGFELYDFVMARRAEGARIDTTILGTAASMAGVFSQAGECRRMGPHAYFMIHEVATMTLGKLSSVKDDVELSRRLYDRLLEILASRAKLDVEEIRQRADRRDWWLDAHEALEYGFVDEVLPTVGAA